jgi:uncharacterized protein (DUF433 family)
MVRSEWRGGDTLVALWRDAALMIVADSHPRLGMGLYTPAQAAYLARVPVQTMNRWVHGSPTGSPAMRGQLREDPERTVTFLDLVQAMAIRAIRREKKIPLPKIRQFIDAVERDYGIRYPFAQQHQTYLFEDELVLKTAEGQLIEITGKYKNQPLIREVVELYMDHLSFDPVSHLASCYRPMRESERYILIDPSRRLGQPLVMPCGYSVGALVQAVRAEGSVSAAAKVHAVSEADIRLAQQYDDHLAGAAA